jgi:diguanylate cyclase (GGDEF)-like protein/PAS domain S-box-containing protein
VRAQQALRESEERFRATFEQAAFGTAHTTLDGRFLQVNRRLCRMLGYTPGELAGMTTRDLTHPDDRGTQRIPQSELIGGRRRSVTFEKRYLRKDGAEIWVKRTVTRARRSPGGDRYLIQVFEDITERKRTEARLARLTRARRVMAECNHVLIHADNEFRMLEDMCRILPESGGYKLAWVGFPSGESGRAVRAVAHAGFGDDAPMGAAIAWSADGRYQGFMAEVLATGKPHIARDILNDPEFARRRGRAVQLGFQSSIALPLKHSGGVLGALAIYAAEADAFDEEEIALLTELASDIAYGITNLRTRAAQEQAEERSRETERRFRETFEQAAVGITRVDLGGHLVDFNQKFCEMLGYTREELIGKSIRDITHPEDYGHGANYRSQLVEGAAKSRAGEKRFLRKDGSVLWARRTMSTACDAAGKPQYVISVVEDITERMAAEERYRLTFDDAPVGIMHTGIEDDRILRVNPRLCEMLGYSQDELLAMVTDQLLPAELRSTDRGNYRERMLKGELKTYASERKFVRKDGPSVWVNRTVSLARDSTGRPLYFIRIIEDITERKALERQFRDTFEQAAMGILHTGLDGHYLRVNRKLCEITGYTEQELTRQPHPRLSHPDDVDSGGTDRARLLSGEIASHSNDKRYVRKDGTVMWVNRTESLARDASGKPEYFIRIVEDITERKAAEERYRATFDNAPVGIMHTSIEGYRILRANRKLCEMLGYAQDELLRMTSTDVVHPDFRFTDRSSYQGQLLANGMQAFSSERKFVRKDGTAFWANRTVSLVRDASGKPDYFIRIIEDITERVLSSRRLAMEHTVTQLLAESATVDEAMPTLLKTICTAMDWDYGARWVCDPALGMYRADYWASFEPDFDPEDRDLWMQQGVDGSMVLLRRAWRHNQPTWVVDIGQHGGFRRAASSRKFGLHSAYAFPIVAGGNVIGLMEFFGREVRQPDEMLLKAELSIGTQIGQFIRRKEAEQALAKSEERYRDVFEASPLPMWVWDDETLGIVAVNQAAIDHYGYSRIEFLGITVRDIWEPAEHERYERNIRGRERQQYLHLERRHRTRDGRIIDAEVTARRLTLDGRPVWLTLVNDVTERKRTEAALRESEEQFRQLAGNIPQAFWISDTAMQRTLYISKAAELMLGRRLEEITTDRRALVRAVHREDRARVHVARKAAAASGYDETYRIVRPDGTVRWVHDRAFPVQDSAGRVYRIAGIAEDITDRKAAEERLLQLAHYDVLTSLPNRVLFYDRLRQAIAQARRNQWITGVMFMDVDRFKNINDTLGHAIGDQLLQQVSERLAGAVRSGDTVGRLGGDEFAIVLSNLGNAQNAKMVAQKIMAAFNEPFKLGSAEIFVTTSIGITLYPEDSTDQDTLIKNADAAMYKAKEAGRNAYQFYTREMGERGIALLNLEGGLRRALERDEFLLYYQPKAGVRSGEITGFEALLRWRHPERGLVLPDEFIPVLEETGLIVPVGEWVVNAACMQLNEWAGAGLDLVPVAINLSARQFLARDLGPTIKRILDRHRIDPGLIELEITESSLMVNPEEATRTLEYLKSLGVGISIDDFGTGYSSLGYLKRFPLDSLKVDRSFVRDVTTNADDATITRAVITMAHSLGLKVVAEGVETEAQLAFLAENGCDQIQGYYFARPQPAADCVIALAGRGKVAVAFKLKKA